MASWESVLKTDQLQSSRCYTSLMSFSLFIQCYSTSVLFSASLSILDSFNIIKWADKWKFKQSIKILSSFYWLNYAVKLCCVIKIDQFFNSIIFRTIICDISVGNSLPILIRIFQMIQIIGHVFSEHEISIPPVLWTIKVLQLNSIYNECYSNNSTSKQGMPFKVTSSDLKSSVLIQRDTITWWNHWK